MAAVRFGVVGMGVMGVIHAKYLRDGGVEGATLAALCTRNAETLSRLRGDFPNAAQFTSYGEMLKSGTCDAVLIVTPHYDHPQMVAEAFAANHHVLVEKPLAVTLKAANQIVVEAAKHPQLKFGLMYNQRANPMYQKLRELITSGQVGEISRITWVITNWFRTHAYYKLSAWRATWKGEGGGVLINQCLHNIDMLWWATGGMKPARITAIAQTGKTHPIEVEDEVSAILEYPNGAVGHFVTTTGEFPGTNRLEIAGSRGKVVAERDTLYFTQTAVDVQEYNRTSPKPFGTPDATISTFSFPPMVNEHQKIVQDFVNAIAQNTPSEKLLSPGADGPHALEMANGILMAGITRKAVQLPLNADAYESFLDNLIEG